MLVSRVAYDTSCGSIGAPCLSVCDSRARMTSVSGACELVSSDPIDGDTAVCSVPTAVVANLGDRDDATGAGTARTWSTAAPATTTRSPAPAATTRSAAGSAATSSRAGTATTCSTAARATTTSRASPYVEEGMTHGTDTYVGGGGYDTVTYEGRTEDLSLSPDGVANDGAAGEHDDIGTDVMAVGGGHGADTMTGNGARNVFGGGEGDDVLTGAGGDDHLVGGVGRRPADRRRRAGPARRRGRRRHARRRHRRRPLLGRLRRAPASPTRARAARTTSARGTASARRSTAARAPTRSRPTRST